MTTCNGISYYRLCSTISDIEPVKQALRKPFCLDVTKEQQRNGVVSITPPLTIYQNHIPDPLKSYILSLDRGEIVAML